MLEQHRARLRHEREIERLAIDGGAVQWLVGRELGAEHLMAYRMTVDRDSAAGHVHLGAEEALYVVEGDGEVRVEQIVHPVGKGRAVFVPEGDAQPPSWSWGPWHRSSMWMTFIPRCRLSTFAASGSRPSSRPGW